VDRVGLAHPRIRQQVVDEGLHALGAVHREADELARVVVELVLVAPLEQLQVARDHPQRLQPALGDVADGCHHVRSTRQLDGPQADLDGDLGAVLA
jgi:hypothetical protein